MNPLETIPREFLEIRFRKSVMPGGYTPKARREGSRAFLQSPALYERYALRIHWAEEKKPILYGLLRFAGSYPLLAFLVDLAISHVFIPFCDVYCEAEKDPAYC